MKVKHILVLFLIAYIIMTIGALLKIMHWTYGDELITFSTILKVIAALTAIWKVFTIQSFKVFLNK